jgi:sulfite reductase (NADPH) flavoprotein alpha-component
LRPAARDNPAIATFLSRARLNKPGSAKETWHVELDLKDSGVDYVVGDSIGIFPANDPALVDAVIAALDAPADFPIGGRTLREVLIDGVSLGPAPDMLFQLYSYITGGARRQAAKALSSGENPDGDADTLDVLAAIEKFRGTRPDPEAFIEALDPLQPRLYSIRLASVVGSGSPRLFSPIASRPAPRCGPMCSGRSTSRCRPIRPFRSS